jgi:hypothetical protein
MASGQLGYVRLKPSRRILAPEVDPVTEDAEEATADLASGETP